MIEFASDQKRRGFLRGSAIEHVVAFLVDPVSLCQTNADRYTHANFMELLGDAASFH